METRTRAPRAVRWALAGACALVGVQALAETEEAPQPTKSEELERRLEELAADNEELEASLEALREELRRGDVADEAVAGADEPPEATSGLDTSLWSRRVGNANLQLLDLSVDVLAAAGASTARDDTLEVLQGGEHDPRQRGFTLQQVELSFMGAVDPYVTGEAHLIYFLDTEGESRFEIEEAFLQTIALPFGLDEAGFQIEAGTFFTEFGRINPKHPHAWDWQDQPFVLSRFFGGDGLRGPGARLGWLLPLPWFAELHLGVQNAKGETMVSFLANDEVFEERPVGGRPFADRRVRSLEDLVYLGRLVNGLDLSDTITGQLGGSLVVGPNGTGSDGNTQIAGVDLLLKWTPLDATRGWPYVKLESEALYRRYEADDFLGCFEEAEGCDVVALPGETLRDWGFYTQVLWGFRRGWAAGVRYGYGTGEGSGVAFDEDAMAVVRPSRSLDPFRSPRHRISPLISFMPSEFARFRLQYNYDHLTFSRDHDQHTVWFGIEFLYGAHPAHSL